MKENKPEKSFFIKAVAQPIKECYIKTGGSYMNMAKDTRRIFWLDLLRIISIFSVIALHAAAVGYEGKFCAGSDNWQWCNIYGSVTRFCVPVLVMISGVMLLNPEKDYSIKKIFFHKIFHLAAAFILWIIFYSTVWQLELHQPLNWKKYLTTILLV